MLQDWYFFLQESCKKKKFSCKSFINFFFIKIFLLQVQKFSVVAEYKFRNSLAKLNHLT